MGNVSNSWSGTVSELRDYRTIPQTTLQDLVDYVIEGRKPGGFLRAVLENKLQQTFANGDLGNIRALWAIVTWCYNRAPRDCQGSKEAVDRWPGYRNMVDALRGTVPDEKLAEEVETYRKYLSEGTSLE